MRYLLLIYSDEKEDARRPEAEVPDHMAKWMGYTEDLGKSGKMLGGEALQPTATATTVRTAESGSITSDGPFAETKEQLGGFYMIQADNLDEAIEWAAKMPHLPEGGSVEVRPIREFDQN
jgi:hypothetical protein